MTESDRRAEQFQKILPGLAGKRVFLYGTGAEAKRTLEACGSFPFLGVIAREEEIPEKREEIAAFGKELLGLEEALLRRPEVIVIAAQMYSAEAVYQRIAGRCREQGVGILDLYGVDQLALHGELESQTWLDLAGWRKRTAGYDVLSFELLDTLIERDLFHSREGHVRPVFARLLREYTPADRTLLYIASPAYPEEWYRRILEREGLWSENAGLFFNDGRQGFFRELKEKYPGKRCLHVGHSLLENGIIPRICGFDTCRMVYFDLGQLTAFLKEEKEECPAAGADRQALLAAMGEVKAVSFDIFDTLLVRETADFRDVFALTARRAGEEGILRGPAEEKHFAAAREAAQAGEISFEELYRRVGNSLGLPREKLRRLKELELQTEERLLLPRREVAALIGEVRRLGKQVVLTSDMYLSEEELERLLQAKGITGFGRIFVSSRYGLCKRDGLLGLLPGELGFAPGEILHIGDSPENDGLPARRAGIRFFRIPPARRTEAPGAEAGEDLAVRFFRGIWQARRFSDPFGGVGQDREAALYRYGYTAAAPLLAGWLVWFFLRLLRKRPGRILFAARDGWLLRQLYERMRGESFPESVYFYTSRHAAFLLCADRPETAGFVADMAGNMSPGRMLGQFFDLEEPDVQQEAGETLAEVIRRNSGPIRKRAEEARRNYARYREICGLTEAADLCYVDFVAAGTSQRLLEEASGRAAEGAYFGRPLTAGGAPCSIRTYISGESGAERKFLARYLELEYYMTSPEPSLRAFDPEGKPLFMEEIRTEEELREIGVVHQAIRDFFREWLDLCDWRKLMRELSSGRQEEARRRLESIGRGLPAEKVCRMYLASVSRDPWRHYYDDWSGRWIETEPPA